ncbi:hypothetical protein [Paraburkholderia saeva]|uniref:hypothetical protein n=1 Tax=Paraburkholderia saeva TaxID=2777537 RepID=UPI001D4BEDB9|nr:hypothetical protein [Paraburkholderia saeva]CAG4898841.1 hypothetical protein R70241_02534 [Paraburkholderia saeva]
MYAWSAHCPASRRKRLLAAIATLAAASLCACLSACGDDDRPATRPQPAAPSITATDTPAAPALIVQTPSQTSQAASDGLVALAPPVIHTAD